MNKDVDEKHIEAIISCLDMLVNFQKCTETNCILNG